MRYGCVNHTTYESCAGDAADWCIWHESTQRCAMEYDDADFVQLLLWSRTRVACNGSKLADVVDCSFSITEADCNLAPKCGWIEGACYPKSYGPLVNKPKSLALFKGQVCAGHVYHSNQ